VKLELTSSFVFGGSSAMQSVSEGGLMVWGISTNGASFSRVLNDIDAIELDVPNGTWTFSAVAWDSSDATVLDNEDLRCARSEAMKLEGAEVKVSLSLSRPNCNNLAFRGGVTAQNNLNLVMCQSVNGILLASDKCTYNAMDPNRKVDKAPVGSVLVRMVEFDKFGNNVSKAGEGLSRCLRSNTSLSGEMDPLDVSDIMLPVGDPAKPSESPFRMELEFYWDNLTCDGGTASNTLVLPQGLVSPGLKLFSGVSDHIVFVPVPDSLICGGREALATFPGGDGTKERPWVICSAKQLYNIFSNNSYLLESFRLAADIDLNPFSKGLTAVAPSEWPASAASWEEGQNWQPIGYDGSTYTLVTNGFQGSFFGGGHQIKNMRARMNDSKVGFIGEWDTGTAGHSVTGLVFENPEIKGNADVGGVVGTKSGAAMGLLANIEVRGGEVTAGEVTAVSRVGGILGHGTNSNLLNLKTSRVKIEGEGMYVGGIFGFIANSEMLNKLVSRSYVGGPEWANPSVVGGIGGRIGSTSLQTGMFSEWASESIVVGNQYVGGLLGEWSSTFNGIHRPLENAYAAGSVSIRGQAANYMGGLFGTNYNNAALTNAYFAGSLVNNATNCAGACSVGWLTGSANAMTRTQVYVMMENAGGHFSLLPRAEFGDDPDGPSGAAPWTIPDVSTTAIYTAGTLAGLTAPPWVHLLGDMPRLVFEKHPCSAAADADGISPRLLLANQKAKWGSASKPLMICRRAQFNEITGHVAAGKVAVIVGALNLASSGAHVSPTIVAGAYLTGEGGYIHGLRRIESPAVAFDWAPFNTINGVLKNLYIAGVDLNATAISSSSISGLAVTNNGFVENVKFLTGKLSQNDPDVKLAGLVNVNSSTGILQDVSFEGSLIGDGQIAGLVRNNSGTIRDAQAAGDLRIYNGGNLIAGVAITNTDSGVIRRVSMSSKLNADSFSVAANNVGMVVETNSGTIEDVHVTSEAYWRARFGANASQVAVSHTGSVSSMKRVVVEGFLFDMQDSTAFTAGHSNIVQTLSSSSFASIYAVPAGRLIADAAPGQIVSCSGTSLVFSPGLTLPSAFTGYWQAGMLAANKVMWVLFDDGNGKVNYAHATGSVFSGNLTVTLSQTCGFLEYASGVTRIKLVQDFDNTLLSATGSIAVSPYIGFNPNNPQRFASSSLLGNDWDQNIPGAPVANSVIARDSAGEDWILDIMGEFLTTGTTTTPNPIWEVEADERIELFRLDK